MIEARGLTKRYGPKTAVDGISFTVRPGTVTGFLGPNGAGKSTTIRCLLDLIRPTSGTCAVAGLDWRRPSLTRQEKFADVLRAARVSVTLRREKGHDIDAACGQLRLRTEREGLPAAPASSPA